jgi:hypothetical protein
MKRLKTYKLFESFEEDKNFISDVLLELNDIGYITRVWKSGTALDFGVSEGTPYFWISKEFSASGSYQRESFNFSDVKNQLLTIKSYLDDRWIKCGVVFEGDPKRIKIDINEEDYDLLDNWFDSKIVNLIVFFNI